MYTMSDVADHLGITRISRGHAPMGTFNVICPFCGDDRGKCNMVIAKGEKENVFHCYNCDAAGSMYDLYAKLKGITDSDGLPATKKAAMEMRELLGAGINKRTCHQVKIPKKQEKKASAERIDRVYRILLSQLSLRLPHKIDLLRRGLTDAQIERVGFRSTPDPADCKNVTRVILKNGISVQGVPGFFKDRYGDWTLNIYAKNSGYLCPVYNSHGQITGFQIRLDDPKNAKYLWLSSAGRKQGVSSGSPVTFVGDPDTSEAVITEGILKAVVVHALSGRSVIGIAGVDNMAELPGVLKALPNLQRVYEAVDMDKYMSLVCDGNDKHCEDCNGHEICPHKERKIRNIRRGHQKLLGVCKDYERILMRWDYSIVDGVTVWNGNLKGLDDWLLKNKDRKRAL